MVAIDKGFTLYFSNSNLSAEARKKVIQYVVHICTKHNMVVFRSVDKVVNDDKNYKDPLHKLIVSYEGGYVDVSKALESKYPEIAFSDYYLDIVDKLKAFKFNKSKYSKRDLTEPIMRFFDLVEITKRVPRELRRTNISVYNCMVTAWNATDSGDYDVKIAVILYYLSRIYTTKVFTNTQGHENIMFNRHDRTSVKLFDRLNKEEKVFGVIPRKDQNAIKFAVANMDDYKSTQAGSRTRVLQKARKAKGHEKLIKKLAKAVESDRRNPSPDDVKNFRTFLGYLECV